MPSDAPSSTLKKSFWRRDSVILAACFVLALAFWLGSKLSLYYTTYVPVAIRYVLPDQMSFKEEPVKEIKVLLNGKGWRLLRAGYLNQRDTLVVYLSDAERQLVSSTTLKALYKEHHSGEPFDVLSNSPEVLSVELEKTYKKLVPVKLVQEIGFFPDFEISGDVVLEPDTVALYGPQQLLDSIREWPTERLKLQNIKEAIHTSIKLQTPAQQAVRTSVDVVDVHISVEEFTEKVIEIPIRLPSEHRAKGKIRILPESVKIYAYIPLSMYDKLSKDDFLVEADLDKQSVQGDIHIAPLRLRHKPPNINKVKIHPRTVEVMYFR